MRAKAKVELRSCLSETRKRDQELYSKSKPSPSQGGACVSRLTTLTVSRSAVKARMRCTNDDS